MAYITINEAATRSGKSIQTIRRMIKHHKIGFKRQQTAQGFNYLIEDHSLNSYIQAKGNQTNAGNAAELISSNQDGERMHRPLEKDWKSEFKEELGVFNQTVQKLIEQNKDDKNNFFGLIKTFQDRIIILEDQIKLLEAPQSKWWQIWK